MNDLPATSRQLGTAICAVLGIEHDNIRRLVLTIDAADVPTIDVTRYVRNEDIGLLCTVLERYKVKAVDRAGLAGDDR